MTLRPSLVVRLGGPATAVLLAACHAAPDDPRVVTPDEQAQLNDAATMLSANSVDLNAATEVDEPEDVNDTPDQEQNNQ